MRQKFLFNVGENRFVYNHNNEASPAAPEKKPITNGKIPKDGGQKKAGEDYISKAQERIFTQEVSVEDAKRAIAETERLLAGIDKNLITSSGAADALKPYEIMAGMTRNEKGNLSAGDYSRALYRSIKLLQADLGVKADGMMGAQTMTALLEKGSQPNATTRVKTAMRSFTLSGNREQPVLAKAKKQASEAALARAPKAKADAAALASVETAPQEDKDRVLKNAIALPNGFAQARKWGRVDFNYISTHIEYSRATNGYTVTVDGKPYEYTQAEVDAATKKPKAAEAAPLASVDTRAAPEKIDDHAAMLKAAANFIIDHPSEENQTFKYKGETIYVTPTNDGYLIGKQGQEDFYSKETLSGLAG